MKRLVLSFFIACLVLCAVSAQAVTNTYTFNPKPADLSDLDHYQAYQWAISWSTNEIITGANLHFTNITNTQEPESNDVLKVWLLDNKNTNPFGGKLWYSIGSNAYSTSYRWTDNQSQAKPFNYSTWPTQKYLVGSWTDMNGSSVSQVDMPFDAQLSRTWKRGQLMATGLSA